MPSPGFVVKGFDATGTKVFLNICYSTHVSSPHEDSSGRIRVPMSIGSVERELDRTGNACSVIDIIFNQEAVVNAAVDPEFKHHVMTLILGGVKLKHELDLADLRPLKLGYKGQHPKPQRIRIDKSSLIQELPTCHPTDLVVPEFDFWLVDGPGGSRIDVLRLAQYQSTESVLKQAMRSELGTGLKRTSQSDLVGFTRAEITIHNIPNIYLVSLQVSSERIVFRSAGLKFKQPVSIWFPIKMKAETATANYAGDKLVITMEVSP